MITFRIQIVFYFGGMNMNHAIINQLEQYLIYLQERQRIINWLSEDRDNIYANMRWKEFNENTPTISIMYSIPEDLDNERSVIDLIDIYRNEETDDFVNAIQLCRVKKLLRL